MTGETFEIIRATADDLDLLVPLFDGYRQFYHQPTDHAAARVFLAARLARDESVIFLARRGDQGLGFIQLYPSFSSVSLQRLWILNDLFVAPDGRRQGVAEALLERARAFAVETESKGLVLETMPDNAAARQLYEKLGWRRIEPDCRYHLYI
ncbi:MAG: N-acetyltransferase family protein [Gemmatimonadota bacterium]